MTKFPTFVIAAAGAAFVSGAAAQDAGPPPLLTNEAYIAATMVTDTLPIDDPMAVFAYVLDSLPDRVKVYPTENHYYFAFLTQRRPLCRKHQARRPAARRRQIGIFLLPGYVRWLAQGRRRHHMHARRRRRGDGGKGGAIACKVTYKNKSVCLRSTICRRSSRRGPCAGRTIHRPGVRRIRQSVFPGVQFQAETVPLYPRRDDPPNDVFVPAPVGDGRILIGKRTGFAVYRDQRVIGKS